MSGPDVVKLFRAGSVGGGKLPIMILSADATPAARRESLEAGADEFLTKPVVASQFLAAIDRLVAGMAARAEPQNVGVREIQRGASVSGPLVDVERLHALRRIARGDAQFLDRYLLAAFDELERAIADLREAATGRGIQSARDALHIIEGTGASIGAIALVENCRAVRNYFSVPNDPDLVAAMAGISTTYTLTKSIVLSNLHHSRDKAIGDRASRS